MLKVRLSTIATVLVIMSIIMGCSNIDTNPTTTTPVTTTIPSPTQSSPTSPTTPTVSPSASTSPPSATATSSAKPTFTPIVWSPIPAPTTDLTEENAKEWSARATDQKPTTVQDDYNLTKVGKASIKLQTESGSDVGLRYQLPYGKYWDLSNIQYIHFWLYTENTNTTGFQNNSPWIQLQTSKGNYLQYQTNTDILDNSRKNWQEYMIPLGGNDTWNLYPVGSPLITEITAIEIHADTWDYGFTLWVDGLLFESSKMPTVSVNVSGADSINMPMVIPVLVIKYFPVSSGRIDLSVTGDVSMPLDEARKRTDDLTAGIIKAMEDGSRYHFYKDTATQPSLNYQVVGTLEYLDPLPTWNKPGINIPMTEYNQIMTRINAQDWVMNKGVKEIWIWGYDGGKVRLWESNMSSPFGDISNSDRDPNDLPVFGRTYTVYHYNYGRGVSEAVEDHMHQNEAIFRSLNNDLFWNKFVGKVGEGRAGWAHYPPNGVRDYDWANPNYIWTDIEDWQPDGSGQKVYINSDRWNRDSLTWFIYLMQSYPGMNNSLSDGTKKLSNWWIFLGEYDKCKTVGISLEN